MKRIAFACMQKSVMEDMDVTHIMNHYDYDLFCAQSNSNILQSILRWKPDRIVVTYDIYKMAGDWDAGGAETVLIAFDREDLENCRKTGLPVLGPCKLEAGEILNELDKPVAGAAKKPAAKPQPTAEKPAKERPEAAKKAASAEARSETLKGGSSYAGGYERKPVQAPAHKIEELDEGDDLDSLFEMDFPLSPEEPQDAAEEETPEDPEPEDNDDPIEAELQDDLGKGKGKTKVVTVYSAKGGVGKTTIATELALYLSLVSAGRRNLRVCLVDYNIDFGDVRGTLALKDEGPTLTIWAEEVKEFLSKGKKPGQIRYTKEEIEENLRVYKETGLYVLPAPLTNEDSTRIPSEALNIILDNIVRYGEFDFVICDTGNNTRDSTMIALEHADTILMIMTQNVNTAFCDKAFMETMASIDFDLSNTKLVINYVMPQSSTGITVQEIVEYFPYECIGKIRFHTDVIAATNLGKPLAVYNPNHYFVTQMRGIVTYLLQGSDFEMGAKPKKKRFGFFSKKKK